MYRRQLLKSAGVGTVGLIGATMSVTAIPTGDSEPPGVAWRSTYDDLRIASLAPAHGGRHVLVGRGRRSEPEVPVRVATIDPTGNVRQRQEIHPDIPKDARRADIDIIRTERGYAVANGAWVAKLDSELSVETTGYAADYEPNSTTFLTELSNGIAVATEIDTPDHVSVRVFGFDDDANLRWVREYGEQNSKWLEFLLDGPDGGVVVGGRTPWLASLAADGTERWQTTVPDTSLGTGYDAVSDDGFTLFGTSNMVRLTPSRSVAWQRSYESFRGAHGGEIARTADDEYVIAARVTQDRIRVGRTDSKGRLSWSHEYTVNVDGRVYVNDLVEHAPGEYLVVGSQRNVHQGWALLLSETETLATRTTTPERTTTSQKATASTTPSTTGEPSNTSIPGFGIGAALLGTAAGLLARRR